ncbi:DUF4328 domain-containing protein [Kitasatospora sp. NPDC096147]|uniref:DUF4328 domain-containing protein n=1 Tax=Kitasatospora sp. NPDC096147 TaxID=3364093 RepID=UPI0037F63774
MIWIELLAQALLVATGEGAAQTFPQAVPVMTLLSAASLVTVIYWLRRCRRNAEVFAPGTHRYSPGFAVGGWLIPVAMLWIPRRVTLDVRRASGLAGRAWLVEGWWWARLIKVAVGLLATRSLPNPMFSPYVAVLTAVSGVMLLLVIREITAAQADRITAGSAAAVPTTAI